MFAEGSSLVHRTSPHTDAFQKRLLGKHRMCHGCTKFLQRQQVLKYASCCWLRLPANWQLPQRSTRSGDTQRIECGLQHPIQSDMSLSGVVHQAVSLEKRILIGFRDLCNHWLTCWCSVVCLVFWFHTIALQVVDPH